MQTLQQILQSHNKICWYPSAGADFRELLFLSPQYCKCPNKVNPASKNSENFILGDELPDLFILTDCNPRDVAYYGGVLSVYRETSRGPYQPRQTGESKIIDINGKNYDKMKTLFEDESKRTIISVKDKIEFVEEIDVPFNSELYKFPISDNYGKAFYFTAHIYSKHLGQWDVDVLYILAENTIFAFNYLLKNNVDVDYIIQVRYGENCGESTVSGDWLCKLLKPLKTKYYLRNEFSHENISRAVAEIQDKLPESNIVIDDKSKVNLRGIHRVEESLWSWQGDICWYKVEL